MSKGLKNKLSKKYIDKQFEKGDCFVAFLDILGYEKLVEKHLNPKCDQDKQIKENLLSALKNAFKNTEEGENRYLKLVRCKNFSDCTCYYLPTMHGTKTEATMLGLLIIKVNKYTFELMRKEIYHRGGISSGYHYQDKYMIFSEGLNKAHNLEDKIAKCPRTILDEELVQRLKRLWKDQKEAILRLGIEKKVIMDKKGIVFINPFNLMQSMDKDTIEKLRKQYGREKGFKEYLAGHDERYHVEILENLEKMIEEHKDNENVLSKYLWLRELLFWNIDPTSSDKFEYLLK